MLSWRHRIEGVVVTVMLVAAAPASPEPINLVGPPVTLEAATTTCLDWSTGWSIGELAGGEPCKVTWERLKAAPRLVRAVYAWPNAELPTTSVTLVVLFEDLDDGMVKPLIGVVADGMYMREGDISAERGAGRTIFVRRADCLNGTGGCESDYFLWTPGDLRYLSVPYEDEVRSRLRSDYKLRLCNPDFASMTADCAAAKDGDINCCPSGELTVKFALRGTSLVFVRVKSVQYDLPP